MGRNLTSAGRCWDVLQDVALHASAQVVFHSFVCFTSSQVFWIKNMFWIQSAGQHHLLVSHRVGAATITKSKNHFCLKFRVTTPKWDDESWIRHTTRVWRRTQVASPERNTDILENSKIGHTWLDGAAKYKDLFIQQAPTHQTNLN